MQFTTLSKIVVAALVGVAQVVQGANFVATCRGPLIDDDTYYASCKQRDGNWGPQNGIFLGKCLMNKDGNMAFARGGRFDISCGYPSLSLSGHIIGTRCLMPDQVTGHYTEIDLNLGIKNDNGILKCDWE